MRRGRQLTTIGFGLALTGLLGSGLIAMTSDTASSSGNQVASGTFTPAVHDLDIRAVDAGTPVCDEGAYAEAASAVFTLPSASVDLDTGAAIEQGTEFCLMNAGRSAGRLTVQFTGVGDVETGCSVNEDTLGADESCGIGEGELRSMLQPAVHVSGDPEGDCGGLAQAAWAVYESGAQVLDVSLDSGEVCRVGFTLFQTPGASDALKAAAQSDEIRWTISFVLQD